MRVVYMDASPQKNGRVQEEHHHLPLDTMLSTHIFLNVLAAPLIYAATYSKTTTFAFTGKTLPTGLVASDQLVGDGRTGYRQQYVPKNAYLSGGYLNLLVNASHPGDTIVTSGQVKTAFTISSARVDTLAILSPVIGVCNGTNCRSWYQRHVFGD